MSDQAIGILAIVAVVFGVFLGALSVLPSDKDVAKRCTAILTTAQTTKDSLTIITADTHCRAFVNGARP